MCVCVVDLGSELELKSWVLVGSGKDYASDCKRI